MSIFYLYPQSEIMLPTAGYARVGGNDSELTGYEFSNTFNPTTPYSKWRSSYTDASDHDISFDYTGGTGFFLVILGANFTSIYRSFITYNLIWDEDTGTYSFFDWIGDTSSPMTFTIKAQSTGDGYFEAHTIFAAKTYTSATKLTHAFYPYKITTATNYRDNVNESERYTKKKRGSMRRFFSFPMMMTSISGLNSINLVKRTIGLHNYCLFVEYNGSSYLPYIVRRASNMAWEQSGINKYDSQIVFEEVIQCNHESY